jgi:hypothetical protein
MADLLTGYRGQRWQVDFLSPKDGKWYTWGWQEQETGGLVDVLILTGAQCRITEVSSIVRAIYRAAHKEN